MRSTTLRWLATAAVTSLILAACGGDDSESDSESTPATAVATTAPSDDSEEPAGDDETDETSAPAGDVTVGFVSAGDSNDGGFYQSQMEPARAFAEERGWEFVLVDRVRPANAAAEMRNLARQNPDVIVAAGGTEHIDAVQEVSAEFSDITWLHLGGSDAPTEFYSNATQDYAEIHYLAGVGMALLLERDGGDTVGFVGGPELDITVTSHRGILAGLRSINPDGEVLVTHTGDFNDAGLAIEATRAQINQGAEIMYGFLGGAAGALIGEAIESEVMVAVQPENRCASGDFAMSVVFSQGQFAVGLLTAYEDRTLVPGEQTVFRIGVNPTQVNVILCDATDDEQAVLDDVAEQIASGAIDPRAEIEALG